MTNPLTLTDLKAGGQGHVRVCHVPSGTLTNVVVPLVGKTEGQRLRLG